MARPRSDDKRSAILEAAISVVAEQGLAAPTATIAKQAGVAHGSLFNYFPTKADLLNAVYLQLKSELNYTVLEDLPGSADTRVQLEHLWIGWLNWGTSHPARRRTLAQLGVSDLITEVSRAKSVEGSAIGIDIFRRASAGGVLQDQPIEFIATIVDGLVGATIDHMIRDPANADTYRDIVFQALWKAMT